MCVCVCECVDYVMMLCGDGPLTSTATPLTWVAARRALAAARFSLRPPADGVALAGRWQLDPYDVVVHVCVCFYVCGCVWRGGRPKFGLYFARVERYRPTFSLYFARAER